MTTTRGCVSGWKLAPVVVGVVLLCGAGNSYAGDEDTPFSVGVSQTFEHDSNFSRTPDAQSESISSTGVNLKLDKAYGRQIYKLSANASANRYKNFDALNNQSYQADGSFTTGILSRLQLSMDGRYNEALNPRQYNLANNRLAKNLKTYKFADLGLKYGVSGRWSVSAITSRSSLSYSDPNYDTSEYSQSENNLNLIYAPSDLIDFSVGVGQSKIVYPRLSLGGTFVGEDRVKEKSLNFGLDWAATGISVLRASASVNDRTHAHIPDLDSKTWSGYLNWQYTPMGKVDYVLTFARYSGDQPRFVALGNSSLGFLQQYNTLTSAVTGSAIWHATAKINVTLGGNYSNSKAQTSADYGILGRSSDRSSSNYRELSLSAAYAFSRSLNFSCQLATYRQTEGIGFLPNRGRDTSCSASLAIGQ